MNNTAVSKVADEWADWLIFNLLSKADDRNAHPFAILAGVRLGLYL